MRYIVNSDNYVVAVSFGADVIYNDCVCTEYTGAVPAGWDNLADWHEDEGEKLWRWKIIDGNLTIDPTATAPEEGQWGVPDLQEKEVSPKTSKQTVKPDEGYDGLSQVIVNAMSRGALASPWGGAPDQNGKIRVVSQVEQAGYLSTNDYKDGYIQLSTRTAETITPGTSSKTAVAKGKYTLGDVMVAGDANLIPRNIVSGKTIFGVTGEHKDAWSYASGIGRVSYDKKTLTLTGMPKDDPNAVLVFAKNEWNSATLYDHEYVMSMMYTKDFRLTNDTSDYSYNHWLVFALSRRSAGGSEWTEYSKWEEDSASSVALSTDGEDFWIGFATSRDIYFKANVDYTVLAFYKS